VVRAGLQRDAFRYQAAAVVSCREAKKHRKGGRAEEFEQRNETHGCCAAGFMMALVSEYQNLPKLALKQSEKTRKKSQPLSDSERRRSDEESKDPDSAKILSAVAALFHHTSV
jgi:hypothetical protein